jgi:GTPase
MIYFFVEKYLKTTVFGMTGHAPDYAMLMVRKKIVFNTIFCI